MTEGERLAFIIGEICDGNQSRFARLCGINITEINKIVNGKGDALGVKLSETYINRICRTFPRVNPDFLRGFSEYPGELSVETIRQEYEKRLAEKEAIIADLRKELEFQRRVLEKFL